jgi:hypothetical protein
MANSNMTWGIAYRAVNHNIDSYSHKITPVFGISILTWI